MLKYTEHKEYQLFINALSISVYANLRIDVPRCIFNNEALELQEGELDSR